MSTTSIRWALAKHYINTVRVAPGATGVQVEPGYPGGERLEAQAIWIDSIDNTTNEVPVMTGGRSHRDDFFTVGLIIRVFKFPTLDQTMGRLEELADLLENPSADDPTLDGFDSVVSADFAITNIGCSWIQDGPVGFARCELRIHSRLT